MSLTYIEILIQAFSAGKLHIVLNSFNILPTLSWWIVPVRLFFFKQIPSILNSFCLESFF